MNEQRRQNAAAGPKTASADQVPRPSFGAPDWDLGDLYKTPEDDRLTADLAWLEKSVTSFNGTYADKLAGILADGDGAAILHRAIVDFEAINDRLGRIMAYAALLHAGDTSDQTLTKFYGDMQDKITMFGVKLLFFPLEINRLAEEQLAEVMEREPLSRYKPWLEDLARERPYQLDETVERLFHEKSTTGSAAWNRLFDQTMSELEFTVDGTKLGLEQTLNLMLDSDAGKRRSASKALSGTFAKHVRLFAHITNTLARDKEISDRWRGFGDVAASRHLSNRVEGPVVDALVDAVRAAYPKLSHRYYALKASFLGVKKLAHWDRNAPLPFEDDRRFEWDDARGIVLDAYRGFDHRVAEIAERFFAGRWIDGAVRAGKSPGAFSHPTVPSAHPFILLNYQGRTRDVMTLAHELGHGVHQVLAAPLGALMAPTPLTLAETASVFGEMLTFKSLLARAEGVQARRGLIAGKVEDMLNTVIRQIAFYQFEREVHLARREGELKPEQIGEIWLRIQAESLGPSIDLKPGYETFWCYVPHFIHAPFYVYAYAFGDCLVNSLYALYEQAHEGFAESYLDLLKAGGSKPYFELLAPFGLDARDPEFWNFGLDMISRLIDELEGVTD